MLKLTKLFGLCQKRGFATTYGLGSLRSHGALPKISIQHDKFYSFDCVEWCPKPCHYGLEEYPPPENRTMTGFQRFLNLFYHS